MTVKEHFAYYWSDADMDNEFPLVAKLASEKVIKEFSMHGEFWILQKMAMLLVLMKIHLKGGHSQ